MDGLNRKAEAGRFCTGMTLPEAEDGQRPVSHPSLVRAWVLPLEWAKRPHPPHVCGDDKVEQIRLSQAAVLGARRGFCGLICFLY